MPVFVHLTPHGNLPAIRRGGIRPMKPVRGVYALPVTRNFYISHQWLRELRRSGGGTIMAVYFRVPDDEPVEVGHFGGGRRDMTAAEAVALMMAAEQNDPNAARAADETSKAVRKGAAMPSSPEGYEMVIRRAIGPEAILRVKTPPQVVGWRYKPGSHGKPPCACICCERGAFGIQKLLRATEADEAAGRKPRAVLFGRPAASDARVDRMKAALKARR